jgi:ATP-dependent 26S proteasome regulatory subunit
MADPMDAADEGEGVSAGRPYLDGLLTALRWLDRLLADAAVAAQAAYGADAVTDRYRGLYISWDEMERLLAREPGAPAFTLNEPDAAENLLDAAGETSRLAWLQRAFGLSPFDIEVLLIALAPELDLRYERLYAYLQDDVSRRRPSVDLGLNLLCTSAQEKLARRTHFAPDAPLIEHSLLHLVPDPNHMQPPLLAYYLKPDEQIVRLLLGQGGMDPRLAAFCQIVTPTGGLDELPIGDDLKRALPALAMRAQSGRQPLRLYFYGPPGAGKRRAAETLASMVGVSLLVVDLARCLASSADFDRVVKLIFREAWFQDVILYMDGLDELRSDGRVAFYHRLLATVAESAGITILAGLQPWVPSGHVLTGMLTIPFSIPNFAQRRACWQENLAVQGIALDAEDLDSLAGRFRLTPHQIADATASAHNRALWRIAAQAAGERRSGPPSQPLVEECFAAARAQSGHALGTLARKIEPVYTWDDIVLPTDSLTQLREICAWVANRQHVLGEWGFGRKLSLGKGVNALFAGPTGTGKTMAAELIANELGLDLYKIDLSSVVSKYIGETEQNLDRIFTAAENANAILFFDEADALFGKRSEVRDSHDRYANIEIAYLLQKMEQYEGIAILATNLRQNMDEAFIRRLQFIVEFPFPDESHRYHIWQRHFPPEAPQEEGIDCTFLARLRLAGGNIKNIVLSAAFLAAADGGRIGMEHLMQATRREYQKLGKPLSAAELGPYAAEVRR